MISWLFNTFIGYDVALIVLIGFLIYLCFKVPNARKYVFGFCSLILIGFSIYCGVQVNSYYSSEGGIIGKLMDSIESNKVEEVDNLKYKVRNIQLTQEKENTYSATITLDNKVKLEDDKNYSIFINDVECYNSLVESNYISADFRYIFQDSKQTVLLDDTLNINFAFYDFSSVLKISTDGGETAVKYWYDFYQKNEFIIEIRETNFKLNKELEEKNYNMNDYFIVNYYVDDELLLPQVYNKNSLLTFPGEPFKDGYIFTEWQDEYGEVFHEGQLVTSNLNLYAQFEKYYIVSGIYFTEEQMIELSEIIVSPSQSGFPRATGIDDITLSDGTLKIIYHSINSGLHIYYSIFELENNFEFELNAENLISFCKNKIARLYDHTCIEENVNTDYYTENESTMYLINGDVYRISEIYLYCDWTLDRNQTCKISSWSFILINDKGMKVIPSGELTISPIIGTDYKSACEKLLDKYKI